MPWPGGGGAKGDGDGDGDGLSEPQVCTHKEWDTGMGKKRKILEAPWQEEGI